MEKWKRSARLVDMTRRLLTRPYRLIPLTAFAERYQAAKSSISEDLAIIDEVLKHEGNGRLETLAGAAGGVRYIPGIGAEEAGAVIARLCEKLSNPERILPGGFLYLSDLLGDPFLLHDVGRLFSSVFEGRRVDVILTVETKGIPLAYATAAHLGVPVVIARYDYRVTEGSVVTVNTISGSNRRMRQLSLSKRSLREGTRILIIDDFMKAGSTVRGLIDLAAEFRAEVAGIGVMMEAPAQERMVDGVVSLVKVKEIDARLRTVQVEAGNIFSVVRG
jgi:purine operon repressor